MRPQRGFSWFSADLDLSHMMLLYDTCPVSSRKVA
jgi:hypothetical protein